MSERSILSKSNMWRIAGLLTVLLIVASLFFVTPDQVKAATIYKSGTLAGDETWTSDNVYVINGNLTVPANVTLTIQADTVVKFDYQSSSYSKRLLFVDGTLDLQGTASNPVIFTSNRDDSYGGDTNGDGIASSPAAGDWGYIKFTNINANNVFEYAVVRYGGYRYQSGYKNYMLCCQRHTQMPHGRIGRLSQ